jgi:pSer/pThr/pTyr-binding forkhead associated (FHA) protein
MEGPVEAPPARLTHEALADDDEVASGLQPYSWLQQTAADAASMLVIEAQIGRVRERIALEGERVAIGRPDPARDQYPDIDLRADDAVSRRHAEFRRDRHGWVLVDLGSTNGTRLNGRWLEAHQEAPLSDGDVIEVGALTTLRVSLE